MKIKKLLLTAFCAVLSVGAWAQNGTDEDPRHADLINAGWTKETATITPDGEKYYVFLADGKLMSSHDHFDSDVEATNKEAEMKDFVDPTTDPSTLWVIESNTNGGVAGYNLRNMERPGLVYNVRWGKGFLFATQDVTGGNSQWSQFTMSLADGKYTLRSQKNVGGVDVGTYASETNSYIGIWGSNYPTRIAANKSETGALHFSIYSIDKAAYNSKIISQSQDGDFTKLIVNSSFSGGNYGWSIEFNALSNSNANHVTSKDGYEFYNTNTCNISQTLNSIPNGIYRVSVQGLYRGGEAGYDVWQNQRNAFLYANDNTVAIKNIKDNDEIYDGSPSVGSWNSLAGITPVGGGQNPGITGYVPNNVDAADYAINTDGKYVNTILVEVTNNTLNLGVKSEGNNPWWNWTYLDNFRLIYLGDGTITVPEGVGMTTYTTTLDLDFSTASLKAYKVISVDENYVHLEDVTEAPAGTPLFIIGETEKVPVIASASAVDGNLLVACTEQTTVNKAASGTNYVFAYNVNDIDATKGFYSIGETSATLPAGKAYLHVDGEANSRLMISLDEETGISSLGTEKGKIADGKFMENGKIVIVKNGVHYIINGLKK